MVENIKNKVLILRGLEITEERVEKLLASVREKRINIQKGFKGELSLWAEILEYFATNKVNTGGLHIVIHNGKNEVGPGELYINKDLSGDGMKAFIEG